MIQKTYFSLLKGTQVNRMHPREVSPPGLVRARNFIPSQSDLALTLRPDIVDYGSDEYSIGTFYGIDDYLNSVVFSQQSANRAWITRVCPMQDGVQATLAKTYTIGTVTSDGTSVTGSGTTWLANVWPHCWISWDNGDNYYCIKEVGGDTKIELYDTPSVDASADTYTIICTHDYQRADYPLHTEAYINSLIYNACSPTKSDASTTISGPFRSTLEVSGQNWTAITPAASAGVNYYYYFRDIYGDSGSPETLVAVGAKITGSVMTGTICTTSDGETFTEVKSTGTNTLLRKVFYANGLWVAVGSEDVAALIYTSPDATNWTQRTLPTSAPCQPTGLTYGAGLWILTGYSELYSSPDGITWTYRNGIGYSVAYNGSYFVAVGSSGSVYTSTDGVTWSLTFRTGRRSTQPTWNFADLTWDATASKWVACGNKSTGGALLAYAASNGATWTEIPTSSGTELHSVRYHATPAYTVAVGVEVGYKITSGTTATLASGLTGAWQNVVNYSGLWMTFGGSSSGNAYFSADGLTWFKPSASSSYTHRTSAVTVATGWTGLVALGSPGSITRSVDLTHFYSFTTGLSGTLDVYASLFSTAPSTAKLLVVVGKDGLIGTSLNGLNWTAQTSAATDDFYGLAIKNDFSRYVAVGQGGIIYTCDDDGATWVGQTSGVATDLCGVARNTTMFCAVGAGGIILTSADGATWTPQTSGTAVDLKAVCWGGTHWVVVGEDICLYSTDGTSWSTSATDVSGSHLLAVCTDDANFLAVGSSGKMWSSADGETWTERTSGIATDLYTCVYTATGDDWWALGASGVIIKADTLAAAWTRMGSTPSETTLYDVFSDGTNTVAVGPGGAVYRVISGLLTKVTAAPAIDYYGVVSDDTTWVLVGASGLIYTTTDFSTFTLQASDTTETLHSVCWNGSVFIAVGTNGITTNSADGATWGHIHSGSSSTLNKVRYGNGMVVAVSNSGETYRSTDDGGSWVAGADFDRDLRDACCDTTDSHAAIAAIGTMTLTDVPDLAETFVVDTQTFTWVAARGGTGEVTQGATTSDCVTNIVTAVMSDLSSVTAADGTEDTVVVTATTPGEAGNSIVFTTASTGLAMNGDGVLGGTTSGQDVRHIWIAIAGTGEIYHSDTGFADGFRVDSGIPTGLMGCIYTGTRYWVVGSNGTIYYATEGEINSKTWHKLTGISTGTLYAVGWDGSKVYAVGTGSSIVSSSDATSLTSFAPLSSLYRASIFAVVDGYVILFGTSEWNSSTSTWEWQRRRVRWTAPGTYDDFDTAEQAGFADVFGEGNFVDARTLGHTIIIWESSNISVLSQTGILEAPWEYRVIERSNRIISNPLVVNDVAYWVEASGLLYRSNGVSVETVPCGFDLTAWSDYDSASPVQLVYDESSGCIVIFQPVTSGTPICYFYSPLLDVVTECSIPTIRGPRYATCIVGTQAGQGVPTLMMSYGTSNGYPTRLAIGKFNYGQAITGADFVGAAATYGHWHGEAQTGFLQLVSPGQKVAVRALVAKVYQDAATMRWAFSGRGSDEDSWSGASDTQGTISVDTSAVTGTGTMFSSLLGTSTGSETVYTGAVVPAWAWNVVVTNAADVVQTTPAYTVTGAYEITFTDALTSGWKVYAYWDADPSPFMAVGDVIETSEGFHEILTIPDRASATLAWYPSTTLSGTHWHTDTPTSGEKEAYAGFPLLVDSLQVRIVIVPTVSSTATKVKLLGFEVHHQAAGPRQMVR